MRKIIYYIIIIFIAIFLIYTGTESILPTYSKMSGPQVVIGSKPIRVMVADSLEKQLQGLSDRSGLCPDCGMLFVFPQAQTRNFWMKDMRFPLDIIWISGSTIVKIDKRLPPEGDAPVNIYGSDAPVNYVLEVNGGYCDAFNIKVGDEIKIAI